jgi:murein DD-endopeptidase MepM/ murein hydrolase activator NlpD
MYVATPVIAKAGCLRRCASRRRAQGGSTLKITGRSLDSVVQVIFHGSFGKGDDAVARVRAASPRRINVRVPLGAVTGPLSAVTRQQARSPRTAALAIMPPPPPAPNTELTPVSGPRNAGTPRIETGTSRTKAFIGARRAVTFSFRLSGAVATAVTVELVRADDGSPVRTWNPDVAAGEVGTVSWDGRLGRTTAAPGRYSFRLTAAGADGSEATSSETGDSERDAFDLYDHIFPVRGRHDYGGPGARFGSGRAGHSHQGHDVFASCGTPLVAARGGRVKFKQYHGAAGHYLVIDGSGTSVDYVYMHLAEPTPFTTGDRVFTGQRIGSVGDTGNARGCHLHYEMWTGPGWYNGGSPFDPLPSLTAWDAWS